MVLLLSLWSHNIYARQTLNRCRHVLCIELFYTERSHIRELRVMQLLFYQPLINDTPVNHELAKLLFPRLDQVIQVHGLCLTL